MKWRLLLGLILCGVCVACVKKAPSQFIVPSIPSLARSVQTSPPTDESDQLNQPNLDEDVWRGLEPPKTSSEIAEPDRGDVEHDFDAVAKKSDRPESRLLGCTGAVCDDENGTAQGPVRILVYKRTGYIGYLPMRTAFFTVKCANGAPGEELFFFKDKWCLVSGVGLENKCHDKKLAMKKACANAESLSLE